MRVGTAVIGGGVAGVAVAYHLARLGARDIVLLEAATLGSGATAAAFGGVRQQFSTPLEIEISKRGLEFWRAAERDLGAPCPFITTGYLLITADETRLRRLQHAADLQRSLGCDPVHVLVGSDLQAVAPWLDVKSVAGGTWTPHDGRVSPNDGLAGMISVARHLGVRVLEHHSVDRIEPSQAGWHLTGTADVMADRVVIAAGAATSQLVHHLGNGLCVDREGQGWLLTVIRDPTPPAYRSEHMLRDVGATLAECAPSLCDLGVRSILTGRLEMTPDGHPYAGPVAHQLWVCAGFSGHGIMHAPVVAQEVAYGLLDLSPSLDLAAFAPDRDLSADRMEWLVAGRVD